MTHLAPIAASHAPTPILASGPRASYRFLEFFTAKIRNRHTRRAYARAATEFFDWLAAKGVTQLAAIESIHVAAYIEELYRERSPPTAKLRLAALRHLFDWMVIGQIMPTNPAHAVRGPLHIVRRGKTPVNELDYVAAAHNQTLLWLDDMENAGKDSVKAIMRIMNGQGKGRMTERRRQTYFTPLMSTANKSVVEVLRDLGFKKGFEPYIDRLMDIPLPEGSPYFFEGVASDKEFIAIGEGLRSGRSR